MEPSSKRQRLEDAPASTEAMDSTVEIELGSPGFQFEPIEWDTEDPPLPSHPTETDYEIKPKPAVFAFEIFHKLFLNPLYSDFTIVVGDTTFPAHRSIVCQQCPWFNSALANNPTKTIHLTNTTPTTVHRLLSFLYLETYEKYPPDDLYTTDDLDSHYVTRVNCDMYAVGLRLRLLQLCQFAVTALCEHYEQIYGGMDALFWSTRCAFTMFRHRGDHDAMKQVHVLLLSQKLIKSKDSSDYEDVARSKGFKDLCREIPELACACIEYMRWDFEHEECRDDLEDRPVRWVKGEDGGLEIEMGWDEIPESRDGKEGGWSRLVSRGIEKIIEKPRVAQETEGHGAGQPGAGES